jgi:hypothetical protein
VQFEVYRLVVGAVWTSEPTGSTDSGAVYIFSKKRWFFVSKRVNILILIRLITFYVYVFPPPPLSNISSCIKTASLSVEPVD